MGMPISFFIVSNRVLGKDCSRDNEDEVILFGIVQHGSSFLVTLGMNAVFRRTESHSLEECCYDFAEASLYSSRDALPRRGLR